MHSLGNKEDHSFSVISNQLITKVICQYSILHAIDYMLQGSLGEKNKIERSMAWVDYKVTR